MKVLDYGVHQLEIPNRHKACVDRIRFENGVFKGKIPLFCGQTFGVAVSIGGNFNEPRPARVRACQLAAQSLNTREFKYSNKLVGI
jgi:hypothetical protein